MATSSRLDQQQDISPDAVKQSSTSAKKRRQRRRKKVDSSTPNANEAEGVGELSGSSLQTAELYSESEAASPMLYRQPSESRAPLSDGFKIDRFKTMA